MLQIKNLTIRHNKDLRLIVEDFTFALNPGDKAVLIGEEGNGKSTLLKLIYEEALVEGYVEYTGEIQKSGLRLAYLAQELPQEEKIKSVYEFFCEDPAFYERTPKELAAAAAGLGFSVEQFYSDQQMGTLSGGEKVKLQLARLRLMEPDVLLLDEPSNDIDLETLDWLERFISGSPQPVLFVSHDETLIERTANVVIHLEQLRRKTVPRYTVARMPYVRYVSERREKFAHQEQVAKKERSEHEKQMERYRQIQQKVEHQQNTVSRQDPAGGRLLKKKMHSVMSMGKRFEREKENMTELPEEEDAIFSKLAAAEAIPNGKRVVEYATDRLEIGGRLLAEHVFLRVTGPEKVCIIGKNGAGKTTLLRQIASELLSRRDIRVAYMPQDYEELLRVMAQQPESEEAVEGKTESGGGKPEECKLTPVEFLAKSWDKEELTRIRTYLGSMKYTADEMEHSVMELSGGQKAKLLFLKMSMDGSNVLVLDEPTRNFSPLSGPVIRQILHDFDGCIISISHDRKYIGEVCDTVYRLTEKGLERME